MAAEIPNRFQMTRSLRVVISVGLLALVIFLADWRAVAAVLKRVDLLWVSCAVVWAAADRLVLNSRWQLLLAARGIRIPFMRLFRVYLSANFLGSFLPSSLGVDAVRIAALCRAGNPAPDVIAATLVDRASIVLATFLFGSVAILVLAQTHIPPDIARVVLISTLVVLLACGVCLLPVIRRWVRLTLLPLVPERMRHTISGIADAALAYRHEGGMWAWVLLATVLMFAVRFLFAKAVTLSCGVDLAFVDLLLVISILWIIVMLPITIGAIGVQDAGYVVLMSLLGVSAPIAVSMSLVEHVVTRAVCLPGLFFVGEAVSGSGLRKKGSPAADSRRT